MLSLATSKRDFGPDPLRLGALVDVCSRRGVEDGGPGTVDDDELRRRRVLDRPIED